VRHHWQTQQFKRAFIQANKRRVFPVNYGLNTAGGRPFTTGDKSLFIYLMIGSRLTMGGAILFLCCLSLFCLYVTLWWGWLGVARGSLYVTTSTSELGLKKV
jgi:hypothetical protein